MALNQGPPLQPSIRKLAIHALREKTCNRASLSPKNRKISGVQSHTNCEISCAYRVQQILTPQNRVFDNSRGVSRKRLRKLQKTCFIVISKTYFLQICLKFQKRWFWRPGRTLCAGNLAIELLTSQGKVKIQPSEMLRKFLS